MYTRSPKRHPVRCKDRTEPDFVFSVSLLAKRHVLNICNGSMNLVDIGTAIELDIGGYWDSHQSSSLIRRENYSSYVVSG